ncbi:MAG: phosphopyruvate hydratase [Eubacterium sp.]|nr:phosphopyruvate hydratase [Eubacterium sp.]
MYRYLPIRRVYAREVLDSRGNPTVEVEVTVGEGVMGIEGYTGRAMVPSGASTGKYEAVELRDGQERYGGLGVQQAVKNVNTRLADRIVGENVLNQSYIDRILQEEDGTDNKSSLGANATLGVSLAAARAAAQALRIPLFQYLGGVHSKRMPVPMMNIINGAKHADNTLDFQEFMIMPTGACCFQEGLRMCAEVYQRLKIILKHRELSISVGDEGGFAPNLKSAQEALDLMSEAVRMAGYEPGKDMVFALDAAASELFDEDTGKYYFPGESKMAGEEIYRTSEEMIELYDALISQYPIVSIEDGLQEEDWEGWVSMTKKLGERVQLVGDDLFVTNPKRLNCGLRLHAANSILIKVNQIGTLTEAMDAVCEAQHHGYTAVISHRSGETEDTFIADLAVACNAGQIKTGAPCRTERTSKYNQLLRIEEYLGQVAEYENPFEIKYGEREEKC